MNELDQDIILLESEAEGARAKVKTLTDKVTVLDRAIALNSDPVEGIALAEKLRDAKDALETARIEWDYLKEEIQAKKHLSLTYQLKSAIREINYADQLFSFKSYKRNHRFAAFLVQGSPRCGHLILADLLREQVPELKGNVLHGRVDFSSTLAGAELTRDNIWIRVRDALHIRAPKNNQLIAKMLYKQLRSQHLVLIFDNIQEFPPELIADPLREFWQELIQLVGQFAQEEAFTLKTHLLALLFDRNARVALIDHQAVADTTPVFKAHLSPENIPLTNPPYILPGIVPLKLHEFKRWAGQHLPIDLELTEDQLRTIIEETGGYVGAVIEHFCSTIGHPEFYQEFFAKYDIQNPAPHA